MKIALIGYGKMGHMIEQIALERGHEIVSIIDVNNPDDFDSPAFSSADVAIEFTNPMAAFGNYKRAFAHNVKVVSGSTGWMNDHKEEVERLCTEGGQTLFWASNFDCIDRKDKWVKGFQHNADGTESGTNDVASNELPIASIRRDEVPGIHSISYDSDADKITITHDAHSRQGFALGAVLAAEYTKDHTGLLTTSDLFKF